MGNRYEFFTKRKLSDLIFEEFFSLNGRTKCGIETMYHPRTISKLPINHLFYIYLEIYILNMNYIIFTYNIFILYNVYICVYGTINDK